MSHPSRPPNQSQTRSQSQTPSQSESRNQTISLKIGPYQVCAIPTGQFGLDGGAMFGVVPKVLWEKNHRPDEKNRIQMEARALLLKSKNKNILIDVGNGGDFVEKYGPKLGPKFAEMYNVDPTGPTLEKSLLSHGLEPKDIHEVILTHLHFDHAGGGTKAIDGKIVPTFPNAKYYIQRANLQTAKNPNLRERASYFSCNFDPLLESNVLHILDGPVRDLFECVSVEISNGHTTGQQTVKIHDGKVGIVYCADVIPTSSHVRIPWIMGYDLNPLQIMEEKQILLEWAVKENSYLFFEHDPTCDCALVQKNGQDFALAGQFNLGT